MADTSCVDEKLELLYRIRAEMCRAREANRIDDHNLSEVMKILDTIAAELLALGRKRVSPR